MRRKNWRIVIAGLGALEPLVSDPTIPEKEELWLSLLPSLSSEGP